METLKKLSKETALFVSVLTEPSTLVLEEVVPQKELLGIVYCFCLGRSTILVNCAILF